jgi:hypothetical protein
VICVKSRVNTLGSIINTAVNQSTLAVDLNSTPMRLYGDSRNLIALQPFYAYNKIYVPVQSREKFSKCIDGFNQIIEG